MSTNSWLRPDTLRHFFPWTPEWYGGGNTRVDPVKCSRPTLQFRHPRYERDLAMPLRPAGRIRRGQLRRFLPLAVLAVCAPWTQSQAVKPSGNSPYCAVKSIRMVTEKDGPAIEILSTKPLIPAIRPLDNPPRLVIDLPQAVLDVREKRISVQANQISTLRVDQFQQNPPVTRVVVDLLAPRAYTWAAAGNRLLVHLGKDPPADANKSPFQAPSVASLIPTPKPVAAVTPPPGAVALVGSGMVSGSSITAGDDTALLRLARGGEVHVCPGTTVSVTPSQNGRNVMLGMSTGAIEAHYRLDASSDSVMTPDFRILLAGPGEFHYAFSADNRGNTCVRALPGNTASAIISELMGDRSYQVKASDQLVFRSGHLDQVDMSVPLECGCPPPREPVLRASNNLPVADTQSRNLNLGAKQAGPEIADAPDQPPTGLPGPASAAAPVAGKNDVHVQVDVPFVFRATDPPPAPVGEAQALPMGSRPGAAPPLGAPLPPPALTPTKGKEIAAADPVQHRGFFRRLGGFFAAIFR